MSLLKTKPRWCAFAEAAENGWINGKTGELLVSIRGLKSKLAAEDATGLVEDEPAVNEESVVVLKEQTIKKTKKSQKLIAEVVEYKLDDDKEIIGE